MSEPGISAREELGKGGAVGRDGAGQRARSRRREARANRKGVAFAGEFARGVRDLRMVDVSSECQTNVSARNPATF